MLEKLSLEVTGRDQGLRLDQYLARTVSREGAAALSRRKARRLIADGAAYVGGRRTKIASRALRAGDRVELYLDPSAASPGTAAPAELEIEARILYEDEHLLAIDKPSGIAVQATLEDDRHHLLAHVRRFFELRQPRAELALPHRLDRGTSGVQLLAKTRPGNARLIEAFRRRQVLKRYLALCAAPDPPPARWTVEDRLELRSPGPGRPRRATSVADGGRHAETFFEVRERFPDAVLVEARPRTGRTHQIRVHLANSGGPVLGDRLYGPPRPSVRAPRLMLHAAELRLDHPMSGEPLHLESPIPGEFRRLIERLREPRRRSG